MRILLVVCLSFPLSACDSASSDAADAGGGPPVHDASGVSPDGLVGDPDQVDYTCMDPGWVPGECTAGDGVHHDSAGQGHVAEGIVVDYPRDPPSSGDHRSQWARWGEYDFLPPQRWLHNLEHGGVALLYHPCAQADVVDSLRAYAKARPDDDGGGFRYVLTPYVGLPSALAVVAWEWTYAAECVDPAAIDEFVDRHYRQAPEDFPHDGQFSQGWIGR